ncbi:PEP-CTERM sorting domain-containing protein [Nostoc sp. CHAB 5844]|nr:PEP-CTERM sorting domain-containing protein [Nostoc sp. CHAB 5844]
MPMVSDILKLSICAVSFVVIGALGQQPLWAFSNTPLIDNSSQATNTSNSAENDLLLRATRNIEVMNSKPEVAHEEMESTNHDYTPSFIPKQPTTVSAAPLSTYIHPYSNRWANLSSTSLRPRQVPEPSTMLGLIAIAGWFGIQHKIKKVNTNSYKNSMY